MRIGLLKADYVNADLITAHGDLPNMFTRFMSAATEITMNVFDVHLGRFPSRNYKCDAFMITGSRCSVNDVTPWVKKLEDFILDRASNKEKVVGFCFGHQMIAKAFGGRVASRPEGWNVGTKELSIISPTSWMIPNAFSSPHLLFNHREHVIVAPASAVVIAGNPQCPVQIMGVDSNILGIQSHPEYTPAYQEALMSQSKTLPDDVKLDAIRRNTIHERSEILMARWVSAFIKSSP